MRSEPETLRFECLAVSVAVTAQRLGFQSLASGLRATGLEETSQFLEIQNTLPKVGGKGLSLLAQAGELLLHTPRLWVRSLKALIPDYDNYPAP